jgi:lipopolysaccharide transport protein LptA
MSFAWRLQLVIVAAAFVPLAILLAEAPAAAQEQPAPEQPIVIEADQIVYDQAQQVVDATGHVRIRHLGVTVLADRAVVDLQGQRLQATGNPVVLIDEKGRRLEGQTLTYDFQAKRAELVPAATTVDGMHVRGARLQAEPSRIQVEGGTFTTCNPDRPAYRVTAAQVEIIPGDHLTAHQASLWLGSVRLFTLAQLTVSLRTAEGTARSFPRAGYSPGEGLWIEYGPEVPLGKGTGRLYGRVGTLSIQGGAELLKYPLGSSGASLSALLTAGWLRNTWGSPLISRIQYRLALDVPPVRVTPNLTWQAALSWQDAFYGTGTRLSAARAESLLAYHLDSNSTLRLRVALTSVSGRSAFRFENLDARRQPNRVVLDYAHRSDRISGLQSTWDAGVIFHLRNGTTSVRGEYGQQVADRYHWSIGTQYNLVTRVVRLSTDSGFAVSPHAYFTVLADYNVTTTRFKRVDLLLQSRLCDCFSLSMRYRVIQREFWLEIGLLPPPPAPPPAPETP